MADTGKIVTIGSMIEASIGVLQRQAPWLGAIALVNAGFQLLQTFEHTTRIGGDVGVALFSIIVVIGSIVASVLLLREIMVREALMAQDAPLRIGAYIVVALVVGVAAAIGFVLLIVPGVLLILRWFLAPYFALARGTGVNESLSASRDATNGHRWKILGVLVLMGLAYLVVFGGLALAVGGYVALMTTASYGAVGIAALLLQALLGAVNVALTLGIFAILVDRVNKYDDVFG